MRHRFHALCPYFAMFPETFVERWVSTLTAPGDVVLDPFCGRGTTPFQSLLMERRAIGCDINPVAYCVTHAKVDAPALSAVRRRLSVLQKQFASALPNSTSVEDEPFFNLAFATLTLRQLLFLRQTLRWQHSRVDRMIAALALGSLHGESQRAGYYFSNQMPRTISTKPAYSVRFWNARGLLPPERDVFDILQERATYRYEFDRPRGDAEVYLDDMRALPHRLKSYKRPIRCVITSPPYFDVTNFEEDQWLRLWFLGGPPFPTRHRVSRDDRHRTADGYWSLIADMWRGLGAILAPRSHVVIRLGFRDRDPDDIASIMRETSLFSRRETELVATEVGEIHRRQTRSFRPGAKGCRYEIDCHFSVA